MSENLSNIKLQIYIKNKKKLDQIILSFLKPLYNISDPEYFKTIPPPIFIYYYDKAVLQLNNKGLLSETDIPENNENNENKNNGNNENKNNENNESKNNENNNNGNNNENNNTPLILTGGLNEEDKKYYNKYLKYKQKYLKLKKSN